MKRIDLIRHMEKHGAQLLREGGNHSVHREINEFLAQKICRDLEIPKP